VVIMPGMCMSMAMSGCDNICSSTCAVATPHLPGNFRVASGGKQLYHGGPISRILTVAR
jgi:hypothetical protein